MDGDEDEMPVPPPEAPSPPAHHRKLKRLKKASALPRSPSSGAATAFFDSEDQSGVDVPDGGAIPDPEGMVGDVSLGVGSEGLARETGIGDGLDPLLWERRSPGVGSEGLDEETVLGDGLDPLFGGASRFKDSGVAATWREMEEQMSKGLGGQGDGSNVFGEAADGPGRKKSAKKRLSMEGEDGKSKKKRAASGERRKGGRDEEPAGNKRKLEKERRAHLDLLHAESQRLLRETRDASFRPVALVEKPISSILEKIRQRKLEIMKRSSVSTDSDLCAEADSPILKAAAGESDRGRHRESTEAGPVDADNDRREYSEGAEVSDGISRSGHQIPASDTQEISDDSQHCNKENVQSDTYDDKLPDNNGLSSLLATDLNLNSESLDESSSDEEDYDKENIDPCPGKPVNVNLYRKDDLVKAFVDEEAEEEDDSDHDLMRFKENDEDDESEDEMLDDLIATGCEEVPLDNEKRNELHQKWLEQQDAAATDNVLQRLNCGNKQKDPFPSDDERDDKESIDNSSDDSLNDALRVNVVQQHSKKAKQMIVQMFNEAEDVYASSDDEQTDQRLFRQRILLEQAEEKSSFLSPAEDEPSREVFGLIRKLNTAPDPRKKARPPAVSFDRMVTGGNSSSLKPSFLGRTTSSLLTSSHKNGTSVARTFIFGRDDSNSRSSFSSSEDNSDMIRVNQPKKNATAKFCSSQCKSVAPKRQPEAEASSASLFEILCGTSMHFDQQLQISSHSDSNLINGTQATRQFTAFKLSRKTSKKRQEA